MQTRNKYLVFSVPVGQWKC